MSQRSGVRPLDGLRDTPLPVRFGAEIEGFEGKAYVRPRKSLKVMCREIQTGFTAAALAVEDAGVAAGSLDPDRVGVVYGSEMLYCEPDELRDVFANCTEDGRFDFSRWGKRAMSDMFPLWMLKYLPNMPACHIGIAQDARGPNNSIVQGEASSLLALIEAARVIERGHADVMITGGTGSRLALTPMLYRDSVVLSKRADAPNRASRPFDARRDGMVNGEGAGALVLETRAHAEARGARPLATLRGCGMSYEARWSAGAASGDGFRRAIAQALREAGLEAAQIGHVNAHGLSTPEDDALEAAAIAELLGDVPVTAPKSYFGNLGAGGGAVELIASVLALEHERVPVTLNYEEPDPHCAVRVIHSDPLPTEGRAALVQNQSGTGQTAAIVID